MFDSKSKLTTSETERLIAECQGAVDWIIANRTQPNGYLPLPNPEWDSAEAIRLADLHLPLKYIGGGAFGKAYALKNWPGMVLKLCQDKADLYPEWIRAVASVARAPGLPRVFAHGGDELDGIFWCVLPKYETIEDRNAWKGIRLTTLTYKDGMESVVDSISAAALLPAVSAQFDWGKGEVARIRANRGMNKRQRRTVRALRKIVPHIHPLTSYGYDLHMGNVMLDGEEMIFTDPFASITTWDHPDLASTKHALRANFKR